MKFTPIIIVILGLIVVFAVPNQNGETIFSAIKESVQDNVVINAQVPEKDPMAGTGNPSQMSEGSTSDDHSEQEGTTANGNSGVSSTEEGQKANEAPSKDSSSGDSEKVLSSEQHTDLSLQPVKPVENGTLSVSGVREWTNYYREKNGFAPLKRNATLVTAAILKVHDMFQKQYFEHVSPSGVDIAQVATDLGYQYISIGENLALGNFHSSKALVDAWMASPEHRANLLNKGYDDIGIAIKQGEFKGRKVWLSAQEFGKPRSACPLPSQQLKSQIEVEKENVQQLSEKLNALRTTLKDMDRSNVSDYNAKVDDYNQFAKQINQLNRQLKEFISKYNTQVNSFNTCAAD